MKKQLFIIAFLFIGFQSIAQESNPSETTTTNTFSKNELKVNVAYFLGAIPEFGYEYLINEESGVGIDILFAIDNDIDFRFALTPHYRFYFGKKPAAGFFVEGFGMVNTIENDYYIDYIDSYEWNSKNETDFALGFAVGGKFLTKKSFVFEIYGGIGRNLFNNNTEDVVPRFGLTFGKRF
jgi:hypothetical protein